MKQAWLDQQCFLMVIMKINGHAISALRKGGIQLRVLALFSSISYIEPQRWKVGVMGKFRKKPVVIEAFMYGLHKYHDWFEDSGCFRYVPAIGESDDSKFPPDVLIKTLEGEMRATYGVWIIRGVKGEIYPCQSDVFEATYEEINDS